jgi:hypothetical protein
MDESVLERFADMFAGFARDRSLGFEVPAVSAIANNKLLSCDQNGYLWSMEFSGCGDTHDRKHACMRRVRATAWKSTSKIHRLTALLQSTFSRQMGTVHR